MTGRVHSIETLGAVDGPGLRCVVFLQGCPMRCLYCHNPDTWEARGGEAMTAREVARRVARMRPYFRGQGGVTLSGGEPLMQAAFCAEVFSLCRGMGIHTALDTSGIFFNDAVERVLHATDLVLLDIKHTDTERHRELTGHSPEPVLRFLDALRERSLPLWVRQVIVPGWNDTESHAEALADLLTDMPALQRVELLPYHDMAEWKYASLGLANRLVGVTPPEPARMAVLREVLMRRLPGVAVPCEEHEHSASNASRTVAAAV